MIGQAQIVVGAQKQDRLAVEQHVRALGTTDQTGAATEPQVLQLLQPGLDLDHREVGIYAMPRTAPETLSPVGGAVGAAWDLPLGREA